MTMMQKKCIAKLGTLLGHLRCIATTWHTEGTQGSDYGYAVSQPEDPRRAITVLQNLARGHALLTGRNYITLEDIRWLQKQYYQPHRQRGLVFFISYWITKGKCQLTTS